MIKNLWRFYRRRNSETALCLVIDLIEYLDLNHLKQSIDYMRNVKVNRISKIEFEEKRTNER